MKKTIIAVSFVLVALMMAGTAVAQPGIPNLPHHGIWPPPPPLPPLLLPSGLQFWIGPGFGTGHHRRHHGHHHHGFGHQGHGHHGFGQHSW